MPACSCTTSVCYLLILCGISALKWTLLPMVLATLSHRACNYFILYFPGGFCHIVPSGKFYHNNFIIRINAWLSLVVFVTLSHQVNFTSGGLTRIQEILADPGSVLQECHHYQQLLYR